MKLTPYQTILGMSKEAKEAALAPVRTARCKARLDAKIAEVQEALINAETKVTEIAAMVEVDFDRLTTALDEIAILERRVGQLREIGLQLFPPAASEA